MSAEDRERYQRAAHAMQTGVAIMMNYTNQTQPKHLRVGVNSAMSDQGGLAQLLIAKGVFTLDEYEKAVADAMEREVESYRKLIQEKLGPDSVVNLL